ncbi:MAG: DUF92 domain-containing protein [Chloroflexota bacterium]
MQLFTGLIFGVSIAGIAYRLKALNPSGTIAAAFVGWIIWGLGGVSWAIILLIFFVSSSTLSRMFKERKSNLHEKFSKGSRRDWAQVLANGGAGSAAAILAYTYPQNVWIWAAYLGAMATVTADTWATELGVLNKHAPRLITTGEKVVTGTSGAVSLLGTLATLGGAAVISVFGAIFLFQDKAIILMLSVTLGGMCGAFFDSLLGATIQAIFTCPACQKETERYPTHACGTATIPQRGWSWLNNDWVNFIASIVGAVIAMGILVLLT